LSARMGPGRPRPWKSWRESAGTTGAPSGCSEAGRAICAFASQLACSSRTARSCRICGPWRCSPFSAPSIPAAWSPAKRWIGCHSTRRGGHWYASFPVGSASAFWLPWPSSTTRIWCSSTSRPRVSIRPCAGRCGRSSGICGAGARPWCSPRTTWKRPSGCPIGWPSWIRERSPRLIHPPRSWGARVLPALSFSRSNPRCPAWQSRSPHFFPAQQQMGPARAHSRGRVPVPHGPRVA